MFMGSSIEVQTINKKTIHDLRKNQLKKKLFIYIYIYYVWLYIYINSYIYTSLEINDTYPIPPWNSPKGFRSCAPFPLDFQEDLSKSSIPYHAGLWGLARCARWEWLKATFWWVKFKNWLVLWNHGILTFHILGRIIPTDFHIFQRDWNHQPEKIEGLLMDREFRATILKKHSGASNFEIVLLRHCIRLCGHTFKLLQVCDLTPLRSPIFVVQRWLLWKRWRRWRPKLPWRRWKVPNSWARVPWQLNCLRLPDWRRVRLALSWTPWQRLAPRRWRRMASLPFQAFAWSRPARRRQPRVGRRWCSARKWRSSRSLPRLWWKHFQLLPWSNKFEAAVWRRSCSLPLVAF